MKWKVWSLVVGLSVLMVLGACGNDEVVTSGDTLTESGEVDEVLDVKGSKANTGVKDNEPVDVSGSRFVHVDEKGDFDVVLDTETDCKYLYYNYYSGGGYSGYGYGGMSPLLEADGTTTCAFDEPENGENNE